MNLSFNHFEFIYRLFFISLVARRLFGEYGCNVFLKSFFFKKLFKIKSFIFFYPFNIQNIFLNK